MNSNKSQPLHTASDQLELPVLPALSDDVVHTSQMSDVAVRMQALEVSPKFASISSGKIREARKSSSCLPFDSVSSPSLLLLHKTVKVPKTTFKWPLADGHPTWHHCCRCCLAPHPSPNRWMWTAPQSEVSQDPQGTEAATSATVGTPKHPFKPQVCQQYCVPDKGS